MKYIVNCEPNLWEELEKLASATKALAKIKTDGLIYKPATETDTKTVLPLPIKRNEYGTDLEDYLTNDWFFLINNKLAECLRVCTMPDIEALGKIPTQNLVKGLTELITLCVSFLEALGYDRLDRAKLQQEVNEENRQRGLLGDFK